MESAAWAMDEFVERCMTTLANRPAALLTDIDGTISPIAPTPYSATVSEQARAALGRLAARLDLVAAISGRAAGNAATMVGVPGLTYVGNHGMEWLTRGTTSYAVDETTAREAVRDALVEIHDAAIAVGIVDGILYEDKGVTGSVHYRLAADPEHALRGLLPIAAAACERAGLKLTEGRMVIELRPRVAVNKGTTVTRLIETLGLRGVIFLGDDTTDLDGFRALVAARERRQIAGLNVAVASPESNPAVAAEADLVVPGVDACVQLLGRLADALNGGA